MPGPELRAHLSQRIGRGGHHLGRGLGQRGVRLGHRGTGGFKTREPVGQPRGVRSRDASSRDRPRPLGGLRRGAPTTSRTPSRQTPSSQHPVAGWTVGPSRCDRRGARHLVTARTGARRGLRQRGARNEVPDTSLPADEAPDEVSNTSLRLVTVGRVALRPGPDARRGARHLVTVLETGFRRGARHLVTALEPVCGVPTRCQTPRYGHLVRPAPPRSPDRPPGRVPVGPSLARPLNQAAP